MEVVAAFYPDIVDMAVVCGRGGSAGAQLPHEQILHVLQLKAPGLWETAKYKEQAQEHQACVQKEGTCRTGMHVTWMTPEK